MWTAWQYREVFDEAYAVSDEDTRRSIDNRMDQLLERGNLCGRPASAPLRDGIFELRAKQVRLLFYFEPGQRIIFVVGIVKKGSKVPNQVIESAKEIRAHIQSKRGIAYGIR